jgi:NADH:ubiquinone oxidoreductase subunit 6 (subunit J)
MKKNCLLIFLGFIFILFIVAFTTYDPFQNFFDKNWLGLTQLAVALISIFTGLYVSNLQQASAKKTLELNQFKEK